MGSALCQFCLKERPVYCCSKCYGEHWKQLNESVIQHVRRMKRKSEQEKQGLQSRLAFLQDWDAELFDPPLADFWLKAGDGIPAVPANRTILAGKSPVFRAMVTTNMREQSSGLVELDNSCSLECLSAFVHFIYTAEVDGKTMDAKWEELLDEAVKYGVKALETKCVDHILTNVVPELPAFDTKAADEQFEQTCESVVSLIKVGNKYDLQAITEAVIGHMVGAATSAAYHSKFLSSLSYCKLKQQSPALALDICESIAKRTVFIKDKKPTKVTADPDIDMLKVMLQMPKAGLGFSRFM